jgi:hypothetical protein
MHILKEKEQHADLAVCMLVATVFYVTYSCKYHKALNPCSAVVRQTAADHHDVRRIVHAWRTPLV